MFAEFSRKLLIFQADSCKNSELAVVQKYAHLVELEKFCQTHIFLQNFVLIQPRTSPPNFLQNFNFCNSSAGSFSAVSKPNFASNMRFSAFFNLYKICTLLHRSTLNILAKNLFKKSAVNFLVKIEFSKRLANVVKSAEFDRISKFKLII